MLMISTIPVGEMQTNCYVVWDEKSLETVIIDPGDSGDTINQFLLDKQLHLNTVVATHGHFDHLLGSLEVVTAWNVPFALHKDDLFLVKKARKSAEFHLGRSVDPIPMPTHFLEDGERVSLGNEALTVVHTPGHTPGSICIIHEQALFTGDTLFTDQPPTRTDFSYSDENLLKKSLQEIHALLNSDMIVFPGHGTPGNL